MFLIRKTNKFNRYLKFFIKFLYKNGYLMKDASEKKYDIAQRLYEYVKTKNEAPYVVSRYLLSQYHGKFTQEINKNKRLTKLYIKKKKTVPAYIFSFEDFDVELKIYFEN